MTLMHCTTRFSSVVARVLVLLASSAALFGQDIVKTITHYANPPGLAAGTPDGSYALSSAESIDMFSGHLNYELPLLQVGGRGSAGYTISLKIPSRWETSVHTHCETTQNFGVVCTPTLYSALFGDYHPALVGYGPGAVMGRRTGGFAPCTYYGQTPPVQQYRMTSARTTVVFVDSHGSEHELFDTALGGALSDGSSAGACLEGNPSYVPPNRGKIFASRDGTALTYINDSNVIDNPTLLGNSGDVATGGRLFFPDGTMYRFNASGKVTYIRDRYGNITTFEYTASTVPELIRIVDPEGREVTFTYSSTGDTITYSRYGGGTQSIQVGYASLANRLRADYQGAGLAFYGELFSSVNDPGANTITVNPTLPSSVTLPNTKQYQFRYNRYAELAEVVLPTGGRNEYDWAGGEAGTLPDGYMSFQDLALIHRVVKQRRAYTVSTGGTAVRTTYYEPGTLGSGASREEAEAQYSLNAPRTVLHYYYGIPTSSSFLQPGQEPLWNHGKEHTTSVLNAGATLKTTVNEWVQLPLPWQTPVIKSVTNKLTRSAGGQLWAKTEHEYDSFANITQTTETDWGAGAIGSVIRRKTSSFVTDTSYTHAGETNLANFNVHLRRLPLTETVYKVTSGVDTQEARREYVYDEATYAVQTCSGITRHDTNLPSTGFDSTQYLADNPTRRNTSFTRFGNVTTARAWTAGSTYVTTRAAYDIAGNTIQVTDGNNVTSTATYPSTNACAYPSTVSVQTTPAITSSMTWDLSTGKILTHTDANGVATQYGYEALLGRMISRWAAAGTADANQALIDYNDTTLVVTTRQDLHQPQSGPLVRKEFSKTYDGLGRLYEERQKTGGADIVVRTEYDALGRVLRRSIPAATPTNWETFEYDALDRVTRRTWDDGSHEDTQYQIADLPLIADQTRVIDAAGKWRIMASDGLGRLIQVREPLASGSQDTTYTYNALDNLLAVNQSGRLRSFSYNGLGRLLQAANPESGTVTYLYDGNGNLIQKTDARGIVTTMTYDALNRPLTKNYSGGSAPNVTYNYSLLRLTSIATTSGVTQAFTYTNGGRIGTSTQTMGSMSYPFSYEYYLDGSLKSVTYPSGRKISYPDVDLAGRVTKADGLLAGVPKTYVSSVQYAAHGALASMALGNNLIEKWTYNAKRLQPYDIRLGTAGVDASAGQWEFSYCSGALPGADCATNNGNVMHQRIKPLDKIQNYGYDPMNRLSLLEESSLFASPACGGAGSTPCREFSYDTWSSMYVSNSRVVTPASFTPTSTAWFDSSNRLVNTSLGITYDAAGNQTAIGGYANTFDAENRLSSSTINSSTTTYAYDGAGRRVTKSTGGVTTTFVYDAAGNLAAEYGGTVTEAGTRYLSADHLGSVRLVTKSDGSIDRRIDYLPFGEFMPAGVGTRTTALNYESSEAFAALTKRFTGKERDAETGLDYFGARYFSGAQGRFTSPDPLLNSGRPEDPQSWNRYAYVGNNPLRFVDPLGLYKFATTCANDDTACKDQQQQFVAGLKALREAANNLEKGSDERKGIEKALKKIGEKEGKGATIAFGFAGETDGTANLAIANPFSNTITFNLDAIGSFTKSNPVIQRGEATAGGFFTAVIGHEGGHLAGNIPLLGRIGIRNYFQSATERGALFTESYTYQGMRMNDPQALLWNNSWLQIDRHLLEQRRKQGVEAFFSRPVTR